MPESSTVMLVLFPLGVPNTQESTNQPLDLFNSFQTAKLIKFVIFMLIKTSWRFEIVQESATRNDDHRQQVSFSDCALANDNQYQLKSNNFL